MHKALIDTDILSYYLKGNENVKSKVDQYLGHYSTLTFSEITYYEILAGLEYRKATKQIESFLLFAENCSVIRITEQSIKVSANKYGELRRKGIQIGTPDLLIAGQAITNELELISNNIKHYSSISGLKLGNWNS